MHLDAQLMFEDLSQVTPAAQQLEALGFDALWTFETQHDPFLPLGLVATGTEKMGMGTNIAVAFARTPMATAMTAWDLARSSGGRFMLGLGTQVRMHVERRFSMPFEHPAARVREYILCMRAIWDCWQNGSKPDFVGEYYKFKLMTPFFNPGPMAHPDIPVFLAGVQPTMCRTAGEVADGFHVHPLHSPRYLREVVHPSLAEGRRLAGKPAEGMQLYAPVFCITGLNAAQTAEREAFVRGQIAFYASTPNYRHILDLHGWTAAGEKLSKMVRAGEWDKLGGEITDEMLDAFAVTAPLDKLPGVLRQRYAGLVQRISIYLPVPGSDDPQVWQDFAGAFHAAGA